MKRETREKKFKCEFEQEVKERKGYTMNCFELGCLHQINGTCPILNGGEK